jgi:hypothetical protein
MIYVKEKLKFSAVLLTVFLFLVFILYKGATETEAEGMYKKCSQENLLFLGDAIIGHPCTKKEFHEFLTIRKVSVKDKEKMINEIFK